MWEMNKASLVVKYLRLKQLMAKSIPVLGSVLLGLSLAAVVFAGQKIVVTGDSEDNINISIDPSIIPNAQILRQSNQMIIKLPHSKFPGGFKPGTLRADATAKKSIELKKSANETQVIIKSDKIFLSIQDLSSYTAPKKTAQPEINTAKAPAPTPAVAAKPSEAVKPKPQPAKTVESQPKPAAKPLSPVAQNPKAKESESDLLQRLTQQISQLSQDNGPSVLNPKPVTGQKSEPKVVTQSVQPKVSPKSAENTENTVKQESRKAKNTVVTEAKPEEAPKSSPETLTPVDETPSMAAVPSLQEMAGSTMSDSSLSLDNLSEQGFDGVYPEENMTLTDDVGSELVVTPETPIENVFKQQRGLDLWGITFRIALSLLLVLGLVYGFFKYGLPYLLKRFPGFFANKQKEYQSRYSQSASNSPPSAVSNNAVVDETVAKYTEFNDTNKAQGDVDPLLLNKYTSDDSSPACPNPVKKLWAELPRSDLKPNAQKLKASMISGIDAVQAFGAKKSEALKQSLGRSTASVMSTLAQKKQSWAESRLQAKETARQKMLEKAARLEQEAAYTPVQTSHNADLGNWQDDFAQQAALPELQSSTSEPMTAYQQPRPAENERSSALYPIADDYADIVEDDLESLIAPEPEALPEILISSGIGPDSLASYETNASQASLVNSPYAAQLTQLSQDIEVIESYATSQQEGSIALHLAKLWNRRMVVVTHYDNVSILAVIQDNDTVTYFEEVNHPYRVYLEDWVIDSGYQSLVQFYDDRYSQHQQQFQQDHNAEQQLVASLWQQYEPWVADGLHQYRNELASEDAYENETASQSVQPNPMESIQEFRLSQFSDGLMEQVIDESSDEVQPLTYHAFSPDFNHVLPSEVIPRQVAEIPAEEQFQQPEAQQRQTEPTSSLSLPLPSQDWFPDPSESIEDDYFKPLPIQQQSVQSSQPVSAELPDFSESHAPSPENDQEALMTETFDVEEPYPNSQEPQHFQALNALIDQYTEEPATQTPETMPQPVSEEVAVEENFENSPVETPFRPLENTTPPMDFASLFSDATEAVEHLRQGGTRSKGNAIEGIETPIGMTASPEQRYPEPTAQLPENQSSDDTVHYQHLEERLGRQMGYEDVWADKQAYSMPRHSYTDEPKASGQGGIFGALTKLMSLGQRKPQPSSLRRAPRGYNDEDYGYSQPASPSRSSRQKQSAVILNDYDDQF